MNAKPRVSLPTDSLSLLSNTALKIWGHSVPRFPFFLGEGLKRAVDHSHKAKLLNLDRVQFDSNAFSSLLSARPLLPSC